MEHMKMTISLGWEQGYLGKVAGRRGLGDKGGT